MFFDDDEERRLYDPEVFHVVRREFYTLSSNLDVTPFGIRTTPTHTEDGIPIRKLYVSNLPPKTTRTELFGVFAQYGFIKSCWLRMGDKGPNRTPTPAYAFVTYSNPADAHKALQAPLHEKRLKGRHLKISPADSWHQPSEDSDGTVNWMPQQRRRDDDSSTPGRDEAQVLYNNTEEVPETVETQVIERPNEETSDLAVDTNQQYDILDVLNIDCLSHILGYVPLRDLIRSERVSKRWQNMVQEYLQGIRMFKTSWWPHVPVTLTTAVLRRVLHRLGGSLLRLHIDHHWSALNDRTAHTVGKFCPHLEELKVVGMHTKNWNPLIYGCKQLKNLTFVSCNKLTDSSLVQLVKKDSCIERLTIANNTHVTGLFLTGSNPSKLSSLSFYNCYSLQGTVLSAAIDTLPTLTTLRLDVCPATMWKMVPLILSKLPKLEELSLSEYTSVELVLSPMNSDELCEALTGLKELKILDISRNVYISNAILKTVAQSCPKLESLNVSGCNSRKSFGRSGVGDEGLSAVFSGCCSLAQLDVSYLAALTDLGLAAAARLPRLTSLVARGIPALSSAPFSTILASCHQLEEIDACGCDNVSEDVIFSANEALRTHPRPLILRLAATSADSAAKFAEPAENPPEYETHKLLTVNVFEDRSNPHLRADFVDRFYDEGSDGSFDDIYDHEDLENFLGADDHIFLDDVDDDELEDIEDILQFYEPHILQLH